MPGKRGGVTSSGPGGSEVEWSGPPTPGYPPASGPLLPGLLQVLLLSFRAFLPCFGDKQLKIKGADCRVVGKAWAGRVELIGLAGGIPPEVLLINEVPAERHVVQPETAAECQDPALKLIVELALGIHSLRFEPQYRAVEQNVELERLLG